MDPIGDPDYGLVSDLMGGVSVSYDLENLTTTWWGVFQVHGFSWGT